MNKKINVGFIIGKDDYYTDKPDFEVPYKYWYKQRGYEPYISIDIAVINDLIKKHSDELNFDLIFPKDITMERLQKNDINFSPSYDMVYSFWDKKSKDMPQGRFHEMRNIYENKKSKLFPFPQMYIFHRNKGKYYKYLKKNNIPVLPTFYIKNTDERDTDKIIKKIVKMGFNDFITKPELGGWSKGFKRWNLDDIIKNKSKFENYLNNKKILEYPSIIFQPDVKSFKENWEIRSFWFNGKFKYAIGTKHNFKTHEEDIATSIPKKDLDKIKLIGKKVLNILPKNIVNSVNVKPVMVRIDFGCCYPDNSRKYFVNEIEMESANMFGDIAVEQGIDVVSIYSDTFYDKIKELQKLKYIKIKNA